MTSANLSSIPLILLKTRSKPHDVYEEYFSSPFKDPIASSSPITFAPCFIPVLEHTQNETSLGLLGRLLETGTLKDQYGGMIFTSQRAVEAWADTVTRVGDKILSKLGHGGERDSRKENVDMITLSTTSTRNSKNVDTLPAQSFTSDVVTSTSFPLYTVGPATSRALATLVSSSSETKSSFTELNLQVLGAHTGNGQALAHYVLSHYNELYSETWFTFYEAPRLPFIPLLGMGSENYSRKRLESTDPRIQKKPLLFLVGETRRDVIPKTLMDENLSEKDQIKVEEVEVYSTIVKPTFRQSFDDLLKKENIHKVIVVVVFSPQGSGDMLSSLGYLDEYGNLTEKAKTRWREKKKIPTTNNAITNNNDYDTVKQDNEKIKHQQQPNFIIVTIGPTTRDHLRDKFGFEPDVCAQKPSPEGIKEGVVAFLNDNNNIL